MNRYWTSAPLYCRTLRVGPITLAFVLICLIASVGFAPAKAEADDAQITLPSASVDLTTQRTIQITIKNISNAEWPAGTISPVLTTTVHNTPNCGGMYSQPPNTHRHGSCSTSYFDGYLYGTISELSSTTLDPIAQAIAPGESITLPITITYPGGHHGQITAIAIRSIQNNAVLVSTSLALSQSAYSAVLTISPLSPTAPPQHPLTLTATVSNIGASWAYSPNCTSTPPSVTVTTTLYDPTTNASQTYSGTASGSGALGSTIAIPLSIPAPTVPKTYQLRSWSLTRNAMNACTGEPAFAIAINGSPVSANTSLPLTITPVPLTVGALTQDGWSVATAITWPTSLTHSNETTDCGTKAAQRFSGANGTCRYTTPGTYTVTGSYITSDGKSASTASMTVTVPTLTPTAGLMQLSVNGQTAPGDATAISRYRVPATLDMTVALTKPNGVGIVDSLDLSKSTVQLLRAGAPIATASLRAGADPLTFTATQILDAGEVTLQLNATLLSGQSLSLSRTFTLSQIPVALTQTPPQQTDTDLVSVQAAFPESLPITPVNIDCGTGNGQTVSSGSVTCQYVRAGTYQIVGRFLPTGETGQTPVLTQPLSLAIEGLPPVNVSLGIKSRDSIVTSGTLGLYAFPATLQALVTMDRDASRPGLLDPLDPTKSSLTLTPIGGSPTPAKLIQRTPLTLDASVTVNTAGTYALHLEGATMLGVPIAADATFTATVTPISLILSPLRKDPQGVAADITWPDDLSGGVQCGYRSKSFDGHTGTCRYDAAGTFAIKGTFRDPVTQIAVSLPNIMITIPAVQPSGVAFTLTSINGAVLPPQADPSVITVPTPSAYPLDYIATISPLAPDNEVGVVVPIDISRSVVAVTPIGGGTPETARLKPVQNSRDISAIGQIRAIVPDPSDPTRWKSRLALTAYTAAGESFTSEITLQGPIGGSARILLEVARSAPRIVYAPATYRYRVKKATSATAKEPLMTTWTLQDSAGSTIHTGNASKYLATLPAPGTYTVVLTVSGPFAGSQTWTDTIVVPALPSPDAPTIITKTPEFNRPPAQYRFLVETPRLPDPRERPGVPAWTIDGVPAKSGRAVSTAFDTPGDHTVSVQTTTTYNRTLSADTTVTVDDNQPPTATIDCSKSRFSKTQKQYTLNCQSFPKDADGRVVRLRWAIPELDYEKSDSSSIIVGRPEPAVVTVELYVTDDSGTESMVSIPVDMSTFDAQ